MPYYRKRKRFSRMSYARRFRRLYKRYYGMRKRRRGLLNGSSRVRQISPITADRLYVKLKYNFNKGITAGAVNTYYLVFRGNSCYDPDYSGAGTQPSGYDQYSNFYQYCVPLASKCSVRLLDGQDSSCIQWGLYPNMSTTSNPNTYTLSEIPYVRTKTGAIYDSKNVNKMVYLKNYMSTAKMYCVSRSEVKDNDLYSHSTATNPTNSWYWILQGTTFGGVVPSNFNFQYDITITYYVMFKRRSTLTDA